LEGIPPLFPYVRAGKIKPLAVTGNKRLAVFPEVPTFAELGVPGMTAAWVGIVAPSGTPVEAVQRLNREFAKALDSPELKAAYEAGGRQIVTGTSQAMADMLRRSIPEWEGVVREAGMKPD
jgi:tripartite-type tricarboxylate transporter receptor subunit TctC